MNPFDSDDSIIIPGKNDNSDANHKRNARVLSEGDDSSISKMSYKNSEESSNKSPLSNLESASGSSDESDSEIRRPKARTFKKLSKSRDNDEIDFNANPELWGLRRSGRARSNKVTLISF